MIDIPSKIRIFVLPQIRRRQYLARYISFLFIGFLLLGCQFNSSDANTTTSGTEYSLMPSPEDTLTRAIIYSSTDFGKTWNPAIKGLPQDTKASFFEKKGKELILGTENRGLFMTENGKRQWKDIGKDLPGKKINAIHAIENELYVGVYDQGIFLTLDEGEHWESLNANLPDLKVQAILKMNDHLFVGTDVGIFKKQAKATAWKIKHGGMQILSLQNLGNTLIAGTSKGIFLSEDMGETWKEIHNQGALHYTAVVNDLIVGLYITGDVYISSDLGKSWNSCSYEPRTAAYIYELVGLKDHLIMNNSYGVFRSMDKGNNWEHCFKEERFTFFDLITVGDTIYGGTRPADEYRNRR